MDSPVALAIIAAIPTSLAAFAAFLNSLRNSRKLDHVKVQIDGRLSELLRLTEAAAFAAGVKQETLAQQTAAPENRRNSAPDKPTK